MKSDDMKSKNYSTSRKRMKSNDMKSDDMKSKNYSISRKRKKKIEGGEDVEGNNKKKVKIQSLKQQEQGSSSLRSCSTRKRNKTKIQTSKNNEEEAAVAEQAESEEGAVAEQAESLRICSTRKRKKRIESCDEKVNHLNKKKKRKLTNKIKKSKGDFKLGSCSTRQNKTPSPEEKPQPTYNRGDVVNLSELLFTKDRDFLVTYKDRDRPVQAKHLEGKVVVLHFLPLVPWSDYRRYETTILMDVYHLLHPKDGFEVVFVGVAVDNVPTSNPDKLSVDHPTPEECFEDKFSIMPWTAIPFSDVKSRTYWESMFPLSCFLYNKSSTSVVIDPTGRISQCDAHHIFYWWGAQAYPFTDESNSCLISEYSKARKHPSITELLASPERNHLINNKNQVVPLHDLEDKVVGLFFFEARYNNLTTTIQEVYESLGKEKNFEIVLVYIHDQLETCKCSTEEIYWESFKTMPWLALPYKDPACKKLQRVFDYPLDAEQGPDPSLAIIGPQGKFVENYGADILSKYGISAYPFSRYSVAKLEAERIRRANLNMFWDRNTSFVQNDGSTVEFSQLVGKKIILVVENDEHGPDAKFWRKLIRRYLQMKETNDRFEVIHICETKNRKGYSCSKNMATMSWLSHPSGIVLGGQGSNARAMVGHVFKGVFGLFAFDRDGRVVRRTLYPSIERRYVGFPFGDMEKELLREQVRKFEWD